MKKRKASILLLVVSVVALLVSVAALATGPTSNEMYPPSRASYVYGAEPHVKPACVTTSHVYAGWEWFRAPAGTSTRSAKLVCASSQSATNSGWGWRVMTAGTAIVP